MAWCSRGETGAEPAPLTPVGTDQFRARGLTLNLVKDASGRVTGADGGRRPRP